MLWKEVNRHLICVQEDINKYKLRASLYGIGQQFIQKLKSRNSGLITFSEMYGLGVRVEI
jgi:hypothetical protein